MWACDRAATSHAENCFVFLITEPSARAFEACLHDHAALFRHLFDWTVVAVASQRLPASPVCERAMALLSHALPSSEAAVSPAAPGVGRLVAEVLRFDYSLFGSLPGVA
jgi:hypothetical protein